MVFLGMARKPKTLEEMKNDPIERMKRTLQERKLVQKAFWDEFD
jgi:TPP-dependent pyruvate/acetoin dehydrogenase alpha subunit